MLATLANEIEHCFRFQYFVDQWPEVGAMVAKPAEKPVGVSPNHRAIIFLRGYFGEGSICVSCDYARLCLTFKVGIVCCVPNFQLP